MSKNDFIAGSLAGIMQVITGQPFDLLKIKMQTEAVAVSISSSASKIYVNDGVLGFYKGTLSPLVGVSLCVSIQFGANEYAKRMMKSYTKSSQLPVPVLAMCGGFAGFCNAFVASPIELIRIKLQAQKAGTHKFTGSVQTLKYLYSHHGISGVFQGLNSTILREVPAYFTYFGVYEWLMQKAVKTHKGRDQIPLYKISIFGALAGCCLWLSIFPLDVIKSRIQSDTITNSKYKSITDCASQIYAEQGSAGFYRGIKPCMLRGIFANTATFITFEKVNQYLKARKKKKMHWLTQINLINDIW